MTQPCETKKWKAVLMAEVQILQSLEAGSWIISLKSASAQTFWASNATSRNCSCVWGFHYSIVIAKNWCPDWCGSVDWLPTCKLKGHWFHSQSKTHIGLQARSPVEDTREAAIHWCFSPFLSPSLPFSLKVNKYLKNKSTSKCWWGCGQKGILLHCWSKCRLLQPL